MYFNLLSVSEENFYCYRILKIYLSEQQNPILQSIFSLHVFNTTGSGACNINTLQAPGP